MLADIFGDDSTPRRGIDEILNDPKKGGGMSVRQHLSPVSDRAASRRAARARERLWHKKTREIYTSEGWFEWRCDQTVVTPFGQHTKDLFGIADRMALRMGEVAFIQICARSDVSTHIKKIKNGKINFEDRENVPIRELAESLFGHGAQIHLILWDKRGSKWNWERRILTMEMLA